MLARIIEAIILGVVLYCLVSGIYYVVHDYGKPRKLSHALNWRILLAIALFGLLIGAYFLGWLKPLNGV